MQEVVFCVNELTMLRRLSVTFYTDYFTLFHVKEKDDVIITCRKKNLKKKLASARRTCRGGHYFVDSIILVFKKKLM